MSTSEHRADTGVHFFETLMSHIMAGVNIPKVQIERVVGPILGMFIEDVMSTILGDEIIALSPEFPLLKAPGDNKKSTMQSTNIDWLMYSQTKRELVFLELKTTDSAIRSDQAKIYIENCEKISRVGAGFLEADFKGIWKASKKSRKYAYVAKGLHEKVDLNGVNKSRIIYILPKPAIEKANRNSKAFDHSRIEFFSFGELRIDSGRKGDFAEYWDILGKYLAELDKVTD